MSKYDWLHKNGQNLMNEYLDNYYDKCGMGFDWFCTMKWNELPKAICILETK